MRRPHPTTLLALVLLSVSTLSPGRAAAQAPLGGVEFGPSDLEEPPQPARIDPLTPFLATTVRGGLAVGVTCLNYQEPAQDEESAASLNLVLQPNPNTRT